MSTNSMAWGFPESEAPYYLRFSCYRYERTSIGRANPTTLIQSFILPGVQITRGSSHRYSEDSTMNENLAQALRTIDPRLNTKAIRDSESTSDILARSSGIYADIADKFQEDNFGHINSTIGRIELLTTESAFLGSSKRKYNFLWRLKSVKSGDADTARAAEIGNAFERLSLPVVGGMENNLSNASRMEPPPMWTIEAITPEGDNSEKLNTVWLGTPKLCILMNVNHAVDNQAFIDTGSEVLPQAYTISMNFVELENVMNYKESIMSRSEYFSSLGEENQSGGE
jgi:hypothetical protein